MVGGEGINILLLSIDIEIGLHDFKLKPNQILINGLLSFGEIILCIFKQK